MTIYELIGELIASGEPDDEVLIMDDTGIAEPILLVSSISSVKKAVYLNHYPVPRRLEQK